MQPNTFTISKNITGVAAGATIKVLAKTNGSIVIFNPLSVRSSEPSLELRLCENPTFSDVGTTTLTPINKNRLSDEVSDTLVYDNPTTPSTPEAIGGVLLYEGIAVAEKHAGVCIETRSSFVLQSDQYYLYTIKNGSNRAATITIDFAWKEVKK